MQKLPQGQGTAMNNLVILFVMLANFDPAFGGDCTLFSNNETGKIVCKGKFVEYNDLQMEVSAVESAASTFHLLDAMVDVLPPELFLNQSTVKEVIFDTVSVKILSLPEFPSHPLAGVHNSLEWLEIHDSDGVYAWNWSSIPEMKAFRTLIIDNSNMISLSNDMTFAPHLNVISLTDCKIKFIHPKVFASHKELTVCTVAKNEIQWITREMFPKLALKLWRIDFSGNKISSLPADLFSDMPSLRELKLDNNQIKDVYAIETVWGKLNELWLQGNPVDCNTFCWVTRVHERHPLFSDATKCWTGETYEFIKDHDCLRDR